MKTLTINNPVRFNHQKAQRFGMLLAIMSIAMCFGGWTSSYLVREAAGQWVKFSMPSIFYSSTLVILLSSVTLQVAHFANKKQSSNLMKINLSLTFVLGLLFIFLQFQGWKQLENAGIYHDGNISGSFFYVLTWAHAVHIGVALLALSVALVRSFWILRNSTDIGHFYNNEPGYYKIRTDLLTMIWHFLGFLWLYLFIFLQINH